MLFGFRGYANYRRLHNPLSLLFAVSGFLIGGAFFFWSVPFFFVDTNGAMIIVSLIGDAMYYAMLSLQLYITYYLVLKEKIVTSYVIVPAVMLGIAGWLSHLYGYIKYGLSVASGSFEYTLPLLSSVIQLFLLANVFLIGVIMLSKIKQQSSARGKAGILGISAIYILSALGGMLNILLSGEPNQSPAIILSYAAGFALFAGLLILARLLSIKRKNG